MICSEGMFQNITHIKKDYSHSKIFLNIKKDSFGEILRISSNESFFARELDLLKVFFKKNSFPHQAVQKLFKKIFTKYL